MINYKESDLDNDARVRHALRIHDDNRQQMMGNRPTDDEIEEEDPQWNFVRISETAGEDLNSHGAARMSAPSVQARLCVRSGAGLIYFPKRSPHRRVEPSKMRSSLTIRIRR